MVFSLISNIGLNLELVVRLYQLLLGLVVIMHALFFWRGGYYFKKNTNYFFSPPFILIRKLPNLAHNSILILLPVAGIMIMSGSKYSVAIGCFISAVFLIYLSMFCYSAWHHDIFLSITVLFLSGMHFAFPLPAGSSPFLTLIIFQISILYFFSGLAKLNSQLLKSNLLVDALLDPYKKTLLKARWLIKPFKWSAVLTELVLGFAFWLPEFGIQKIAIVIGVLFHISMIIMTGRGRTFHAMLPITYLLIIVKNIYLYEGQLIWLLLIILLPPLITFLFYTPYNLSVKDYSPSQE